MATQLLEQIRKAVQLAADHKLEVESLCLTDTDFEAFLEAGITRKDIGIPIAAACVHGSSAVCALFRGEAVAIALDDFPFVGPRS